MLLLSLLLLTGCTHFTPQTYVLTETEQQYLIPANTSFHARLSLNGPIVEVMRTVDTWAVDAGKLARLEEAANACTLKK